MKFIRHIFTGMLLLFTLVFNPLFLYFFYSLIFIPESFYEGMAFPAALLGTGIYSMYWAYCIKTYKEKQK